MSSRKNDRKVKYKSLAGKLGRKQAQKNAKRRQ